MKFRSSKQWLLVLFGFFVICFCNACDSSEDDEPQSSGVIDTTATKEDSGSTAEETTSSPDELPPLDKTIAPTSADLAALPNCAEDDLIFVQAASKVSALAIGTSGRPQEGLDIDANSTTCAPEADCSGGVDNQLSIIAAIANKSLEEALALGSLMLALEIDGLPETSVDASLTIRMFAVRIDSTNEECDWQADSCLYRVRPDSFDERCNPLMVLENAALSATGALKAGGKEATLLLSIPLFGVNVKIPATNVRMEATIERDSAGRVLSMSGILAGAVPKEKLTGALNEIPEEEFDAAGIKKSVVIQATDLVQNDIDSDGDGAKESASIGIKFATIPAVIAGLEASEQ
ncbi:MAG: hypothetical protein HUU55_01940 [Myxococcales bacterium]|nr:hypothetical protein [Myxococcales bacterium]